MLKMLTIEQGLNRLVFEKKRHTPAAPFKESLMKDARSLGDDTSKNGEPKASKSLGDVCYHSGCSSSSTNSESTDRSRIRTRRRKRRRMRARQKRKTEAGEFKSQNTGKRNRKTKIEGSTPMAILGSSETSCYLNHQLSSNTVSPLHSSSISSQSENFDFPWGNLDMPMDLSQIEFEIIDNHGVDFELLATKNHQRWLANLEMAYGRCE